MSPTDPFRISAPAALRAGWRDLWRWPGPTVLALLGSVAAALAARAAWVRASALWAAAVADLRGDAELFWTLVGRLLVVGLAGGSLAALLVDVTRAVALCAYAAPVPPERTARFLGPLRLGLERTPGFISVRAVELLIYLCLLLGDAFVLARGPIHSGSAPIRSTLAAGAVLAPSLVLGLVVFAASRVAQTLIARGLPPAAALAHGYDLVLRRFATLARLALVGLWATAPLVVGALLLPFGLREALLGLVALWVYSALVTVVGRDGRLVTG